MLGFHGRGLRVSLDDQRAEVFALSEADLSLLGGKGLGTRLLLQETEPHTDPLGPGNAVVFTTGPLAGTGLMGVSRYGVYAKSPLTGGYTESYSGGHVAPAMKASGFDAIVVKGQSREPVYLAVSESGAEFRPAGDLWGKDTYAAEEAILAACPRGTQAVVIGPAGENLVRFACLQNNRWRSAGRCGLGAVLGSKKVKGLAFWGERTAPVADAAGLDAFTKALVERGKDDAGVKAYQTYGTPNLVRLLNNRGTFPTRYWRKGTLEGWENLSAQKMVESFSPKSRACHRCFVACGKLITVASGPHAGLTIEGPEYETIYSFGGLCEIGDFAEVAYLNDLCDRLGMDTMSLGNLLAFVMEARLVSDNPSIPSLDYGDAEGAARLAEDIAFRRGDGVALAEGTRRVAAAWGLEDLAIHVKGLEPAGYDPRVLKGMGLAYATSSRGACHLRATFYKAELSGQMDPSQVEGKAALFVDYEDRLAIFDSLILCRFFRDLIGWSEIGELIRLTTGVSLDRDGLRRLASRLVDAPRRFNYREGFTAEDDRLPRRFLEEALPETGATLTSSEMETMLKDYYFLRGWDKEGRPRPQS
jgi:aldehyde:ferredoxin oxidoreductase